MIYNEESDSCILYEVYEKPRYGLDVTQKLVSVYDAYPTCDGNLDITNNFMFVTIQHGNIFTIFGRIFFRFRIPWVFNNLCPWN